MKQALHTAIITLAIAVLARPTMADIVISEIMYNPVGGGDYEFIELCNTGTNSIDLLGYRFIDGISYVFSNSYVLGESEYVVLARDASFFAARYPEVNRVAAGSYSGRLADNGERVVLADGASNVVYSVTYNDSGDWPEAADGLGSSLVLVDAAYDPDEPESWAASLLLHGSPGAPDIPAVQDIVVNEVLTHSDLPLEDAIELYNLTTNDIDIGGWYLSDSDTFRRKFRIPDGTVISNRSYTVFYEFQFNAPALGTNAFALSSGEGDEVYLSAADESDIIFRFVDRVSFGPAENGVSFGRYPNGTGPLITLERRTFGVDSPGTVEQFRAGEGAENAAPRLSPVVINEIMYHPPDFPDGSDNDLDEYIEILNASTNSVPLFDPLHASNTWKLTSAVTYTFPTNTVLEPGETILVVGTADSAAFRTTYGLGESLRVFGPWGGKLDNSSESVRLRKPDPPNSNAVPYILVERIDYSDDSPWPTGPDGQGSSLERIEPLTYGNTPDNWQSSLPAGSPGLTNTFIVPAGALYISEFMALNERTIVDEDGDYSDWIEIYNSAGTDIDLAGWHLTDDPANLRQWEFPSVEIGSKEFLVVFASGKDRQSAGGELHTNFRLNTDGEYLAIVRPNLVIEHEISPTYPPQYSGISCGLKEIGSQISVPVDEGAAGRYLVPTSAGDLAVNWFSDTFDDGSWDAATTGIGYDTGEEYRSLISTDLRDEMHNKMGSVYLRLPFNVSRPTLPISMVVRMKYDDGFIVYLNGTRIASDRAPAGTPAWNALATDNHNDAEAIVYQPFDVTSWRDILKDGDNLLAVHGLNRTLDSSDFLAVAKFEVAFANTNLSDSIRYFPVPSPGNGNSGGMTGVTPVPVVSPPGGVVSGPLAVTITCPDTNALIRYTLDGSKPTEASPAYTNTISLSPDVELLTRAFAAGVAASPVVSEFYRTSFLGINEFMARNISAVPEIVDLGAYPDWFEIYNGSSSEVDMAGYYVTDDLASRFKWEFPAGTIIPAGGYLVVFADGENVVPGVTLQRPYYPYSSFVTRYLHTSFRLSADGEALGLYGPGGGLIDAVEYGPQKGDVSMGRLPDGGSFGVYFGEASAGSANLPPGVTNNKDFADEPVFSIPGAFYATPQTLSLSNASPTARIHYTLDASAPTSLSPQYANPLDLTSTTVVRARVFDSGVLPSRVVTHTYFINEPPSTIPVVSLVATHYSLYDSDIGIAANGYKQREIPGNIAYYETLSNKVVHEDCGLKIFGLNIFRFAQKPFSVYFRGRYGNSEVTYQFFEEKPVPVFNRIVFRNSGDDWPDSMIRDVLMQEIPRGCVNNALQGYEPVVSYLNGEEYGLFNLREKLDETFFESNYGVSADEMDYFEMDGAGGSADPIVMEGDEVAWSALLHFADTHDLSIPANYEVVRAQVDLEDLMDFVIVEAYTANTSWFHNRKWWRERSPTGKWRWALFDMDRGFNLGNVGHNTLNDILNRHDLIGDLLANSGFRDYFIQRFAGHLNSTFLPDRVVGIIDEIVDRIRPEMPRHIAAWGSQGGISSMAAWESDIESMRNFARQRPAYMWQHIASRFGLSGTGEVIVDAGVPGNGQVLANHTVLADGVSVNTFLLGVPVELKAVPAIGQSFAGWITTETSSTNLLQTGSTWKYMDTGTNLLTTWRETDYDDSLWPEGPAELGYGDSDEATVVDYGPSASQKYVTTYFRSTFTSPQPSSISALKLRLLRDGGAVVYINGQEATRQNMPTGDILFDTLAASVIGEPQEEQFFEEAIATNGLVAGTNVCAVEIHQDTLGSSDISFDIEIIATLIGSQTVTNSNSLVTVTFDDPGALTALFESSGESLIPTAISTNLTLTAAESPWLAPDDIVVYSNTTLSAEPGVEILMPDDASIYVYGELLLNGTAEDPVSVIPNPADNARRPLYVNTNLLAFSDIKPEWGCIALRQATDTARFSHVRIRGASTGENAVDEKAAISAVRSEIVMEGLDLEESRFPIFIQYGTNTVLRDSRLRCDETCDLINVKHAGYALVDNCDLKGNYAFDTDAIDYDNISKGIISNNEIYDFLGFNSDGIDIGEGAQGILIVSNHIHDCTDKGISVGQASTVIARRNLIRNCAQGVGVKDTGAHIAIEHTTFHNNVFAVASFEKNEGAGGGSASIANSILSKSVTNAFLVDALSTLDISYSLSDTDPLPGAGNWLAKPRFVRSSVTNYHLATGSPAIDRGDPVSPTDPDGSRADMGAFPYDHNGGALVINEIHYHPATGSNTLEFIELLNPGGSELDISGYRFTDGVAFIFPSNTTVAAGEHILVCNDAMQYDHIGLQVFQWTNGNLANNGEKIRIIDLASNEVDDVTYDDDLPWPLEPDGLGPSLCLILPTLDNDLAANWSPSYTPGGTPGRAFEGPVVGFEEWNTSGPVFATSLGGNGDLKYVIEFTEKLVPGDWHDLGSIETAQDGTLPLSEPLSPTNATGYFRIRAGRK